MFLRILCSVCAVLSTALAQAPAQAPSDGPTELIITYRCPPPRRAAFHEFMVENGIQRFEHWKQDGLLKDYRFLFSSFVDVDGWDAMALLSFSSYAQVARWKVIEHASPGGLIRDALDMAWPLNTTPADLAFHGEAAAPADPAGNVYFTVAFDGDAFRQNAGGALVQQLNNWLADGVASYRIYTNRYPGGKHWQGLLVLEYRDLDAFAHAKPLVKTQGVVSREPVIADAILSH